MKRENLFRGQDEKGKWHCGDLVHDAFDGTSKNIEVGIREKVNGHYCYPVEVLPETVGEFTGEKDIKDVKIFENDKVTSEKWGIEGIIIFDIGCFSVLLTVANCLLWDVGQKPALFEFDDLLVNEATKLAQ